MPDGLDTNVSNTNCAVTDGTSSPVLRMNAPLVVLPRPPGKGTGAAQSANSASSSEPTSDVIRQRVRNFPSLPRKTSFPMQRFQKRHDRVWRRVADHASGELAVVDTVDFRLFRRDERLPPELMPL